MWFGRNINEFLKVVTHVKQVKETLEELQLNERGTMTTYSMYEQLLETVPGMLKYTLIFNASSKVEFKGDQIEVTHPLKAGMITPHAQKYTFAVKEFLILINAGWITGRLSKFSYYDNMFKQYDFNTAREVYASSIEQLGYGSYLYMLLNENYGFEKIYKDDQLDDFRREEVLPVTVEAPEEDILRLGDGDNCPFYYTDSPFIEEEEIHDAGEHDIRIIPYEKETLKDESFAVCVDGLERDEDIFVDQFMTLVSVEGEPDSSFSVDISLYDRSKEAESSKEKTRYTKRRTLYSGKKKKLITEVFEMSHIRSRLTAPAIKHRKFEKYNPRRYAYLNFYVFGKIKFKINMILRSLKKYERGPFLLYKGPKLKYNNQMKQYETIPEVLPGKMTDYRRNLVGKRMGIDFTHSQKFDYHQFLSLRSCLAPLDKLLIPEIASCPKHGVRCGVRMRSDHIPQLNVVICFIENPDLYEYMINFINRSFKIPEELIRKKYDKQLVYKEPLSEKFKGPFFIIK